MSINLAMYRYNNAIDRGRKSIQLSIAIMTVWMALCIFVFKVIDLSIGNASLNAAIHIDFNWKVFSTWGIITLFTLTGAFTYGFLASNTELKNANEIINNFFISDDDDPARLTVIIKKLNEITNELENFYIKSSALNLISFILVFVSFTTGYLSVEEVIKFLDKHDLLYSIGASIAILVFVGNYQKLTLWLKKRKKNKTNDKL
ncbi:hypothetical protein [Serratia liquefaciens]|uniref:hypothetical protein n=1 Tax=Serratia liquefaciens TaxID=614 RepID=UPI001F26616E|nr:hypothetical protein [Serratia liquefaciens]MCE9938565.1 hypothetical protein [Serratia liquefaciens]